MVAATERRICLMEIKGLQRNHFFFVAISLLVKLRKLLYPDLCLEFLAATAADLQPQVFYEKFYFQNLSKKNQKVQKNWKK
jgi:hypothetical protein